MYLMKMNTKIKKRRILWRDIERWKTSGRVERELELIIQTEHMLNLQKWNNKEVCLPSESVFCPMPLRCKAKRVFLLDTIRNAYGLKSSSTVYFLINYSWSLHWQQSVFTYAQNFSPATAFIMKSSRQCVSCFIPQSSQEAILLNSSGVVLIPAHLVTLLACIMLLYTAGTPTTPLTCQSNTNNNKLKSTQVGPKPKSCILVGLIPPITTCLLKIKVDSKFHLNLFFGHSLLLFLG